MIVLCVTEGKVIRWGLLVADALILTLEDGPVQRSPHQERSRSLGLNGLRHGPAVGPGWGCASTWTLCEARGDRELRG
jgi:hypothetical protein